MCPIAVQFLKKEIKNYVETIERRVARPNAEEQNLSSIPGIWKQSGFRAERSCADNIFVFQSAIEKRKTSNSPTLLLFIDFKKAFNIVP